MKNQRKRKNKIIYEDAPLKFNPVIMGYVPDLDKIKKIRTVIKKR